MLEKYTNHWLSMLADSLNRFPFRVRQFSIACYGTVFREEFQQFGADAGKLRQDYREKLP